MVRLQKGKEKKNPAREGAKHSRNDGGGTIEDSFGGIELVILKGGRTGNVV